MIAALQLHDVESVTLGETRTLNADTARLRHQPKRKRTRGRDRRNQ